MKQLELVVVQFEEIKRLIGVGRMPQLRLALILLDSATELILHRSVGAVLDYEPTRELDSYRRAKQRGSNWDGLDSAIQELESQVTSKSQRKKLEYFDPKIDFLIQLGKLQPEIGPVIKKLHKYRNETYHRDQHREKVLKPAVLIYFDAACSVLSTYQTGSMGLDSDVGPEMGRFVDERGPLYTDIFGLASAVADQLRADVGLDLRAVKAALSDHLLGRLEMIDSVIDFVADNNCVGLNRQDVVRMAQLEKGDAEAVLKLPPLRARTLTESTAHRDQSSSPRAASSSRTRRWSLAQTRASVHSVNRRKAVTPDRPKPGGS